MIFKWILFIVEIDRERKIPNQTLQYLKHNQIQKMKKLKLKKNNKRNDLKGGCVLEINQEDNTNFITIATKMVDNV